MAGSANCSANVGRRSEVPIETGEQGDRGCVKVFDDQAVPRATSAGSAMRSRLSGPERRLLDLYGHYGAPQVAHGLVVAAGQAMGSAAFGEPLTTGRRRVSSDLVRRRFASR